jgi:glutamine synthetase
MSEIETRHTQNGIAAGRATRCWAQETRAAMVDLKFCDLLGTWQHVSLPVSGFDETAFDEGLGFDGSSIRGWQGISESDMLLMPDASSAIIDPAAEVPTLSLICEIADPITREPYNKDPRGVARRAEEYLRSTGIADTAYFGPECEFFVFDDVSYTLGPNDALPRRFERRPWNPASRASVTRSARRRGISRRPRTTRSATCARAWCSRSSGWASRAFHHHEVASGGRDRSALPDADADGRPGDDHKYVVKNVARRARP